MTEIAANPMGAEVVALPSRSSTRESSADAATRQRQARNGTGRNTVIVVGRGGDGPGIADAFVRTAVDCDCKVLDMAQFCLQGSLVFTFVLDVDDNNSMVMLRQLLSFGKQRDMKLDFHFPHGDDVPEPLTPRSIAKLEAIKPAPIAGSLEQAVGELAHDAKFVPDTFSSQGNADRACITVVTPGSFTPALLHNLDLVLAEHGCVVHEIEHRSDDKFENNSAYSKLQMRVGCPSKQKLSTLNMGAPTAEGTSTVGMRQVARDHGAVMTARWWDSMHRPNGKSLIVFGLSNVLCPYDVLDEVLKEAGVNPGDVIQSDDVSEMNKNKIALLKGKSQQAVQKLIDRLEFTKGARLVCEVFKAMGIRLAIITGTGVKPVAEHVKRQLGIDYVICQDLETVDGLFTGEYMGDAAGIRFRKTDVLKLMADREGIEYRNVIAIGEFLSGLNGSSARSVLETFGPNVFFNSDVFSDLRIALYLLGMNGSHVQTLQKRHDPSSVDATAFGRGSKCPFSFVKKNEEKSEDTIEATCFMVQISAQTRETGQLSHIFKPLMAFSSEVLVTTVRQCSLQDGGMCLGLECCVKRHDPDQVIKELLFVCQKEGFRVGWGGQMSQAPSSRINWEHYFVNRYVITLVQKPFIAGTSLKAIFGELSGSAINIVKIERLSVKDLAAMQITVDLPHGLNPADFSDQLSKVSQDHAIDISFQKDDVDRWMRRLIVFDMDSTLIQQEVIDELAKYAGVEEKVKAITEAAMSGEIDFSESLKQRVALLEGYNAEELFKKVKRNLIYTPGAKTLCSTLKRLGYKMAVISGGFLPIAKEVQRQLGLDYAFANTLEIDEQTGLLTGKTSGPVVTPQRKRALLATIAGVEGCDVSQTIAVGDGANDIPMLHTAGLGIAFCAKPKVQAVTSFKKINQCDLTTVLFLIGLSEYASQRLITGSLAAVE